MLHPENSDVPLSIPACSVIGLKGRKPDLIRQLEEMKKYYPQQMF